MSEKQFEGKSRDRHRRRHAESGKRSHLSSAKRGCNRRVQLFEERGRSRKLKGEIDALGVKAYSAAMRCRQHGGRGGICRSRSRKRSELSIFSINNAGITRDQLILRMKEDDWDSVIDTNLKGAWNFSKAVLRPMMRNENGGSILNISSI